MVKEMETGRYRRNAQRWVLVWVGVFLGVVGIIVAAGLVLRPFEYYPWFPSFFGWIWIPFAFFFLFFALRWFFWPWGWAYLGGHWTGDDAYSILRERFARGEITIEQFEQMTRELEQREGRQ